MSVLTAEQVRKAIERHSAWVIGNNRCFHDGAYEEIADELNARAERTCEIEWRDESFWTDSGYEQGGAYFCTCCGIDLPHAAMEAWDDYQSGIKDEKPFNYCPNCGCKVVEE